MGIAAPETRLAGVVRTALEVPSDAEAGEAVALALAIRQADGSVTPEALARLRSEDV